MKKHPWHKNDPAIAAVTTVGWKALKTLALLTTIYTVSHAVGSAIANSKNESK